jgi:hypothetical protein
LTFTSEGPPNIGLNQKKASSSKTMTPTASMIIMPALIPATASPAPVSLDGPGFTFT